MIKQENGTGGSTRIHVSEFLPSPSLPAAVMLWLTIRIGWGAAGWPKAIPTVA